MNLAPYPPRSRTVRRKRLKARKMRGIAYGTYGNAVAVGFAQDKGVASKNLEVRETLQLAALGARIPIGYSNCQRAVGQNDPVAGPAGNLSN